MKKPHTTREEINYIVEAFENGVKIQDITKVLSSVTSAVLTSEQNLTS